MRPRERVVIDTHCLISRLLLPGSIPGQAVCQAVESSVLLISDATLNELADVLGRPKFDRYISVEDRQQFLRLLTRVAVLVPVAFPVNDCRDPADNKFLEVALHGEAHLILTGDSDLLTLHPWHDIAILSPANFLKR